MVGGRTRLRKAPRKSQETDRPIGRGDGHHDGLAYLGKKPPVLAGGFFMSQTLVIRRRRIAVTTIPRGGAGPRRLFRPVGPGQGSALAQAADWSELPVLPRQAGDRQGSLPSRARWNAAERLFPLPEQSPPRSWSAGFPPERDRAGVARAVAQTTEVGWSAGTVGMRARRNRPPHSRLPRS